LRLQRIHTPPPKSALTSDDIAGIRAIYSNGAPRSPDAYDAAASHSTAATAVAINASTMTALVTSLDETTVSQADCYTFTAPSGSGGTLTVNAQSAALSLLTPTLTVYAADGSTVLGSASGSRQKNGTTLSVTVSGVAAGQQFYVRVGGADGTAWSTGQYALALNFASGATPTAAPASTQMANSANIQGGGGQAQTTGSSGGLLGGVVNSLGQTVSSLVKWLSDTTGLTIEAAAGILNGTADPLTVTDGAHEFLHTISGNHGMGCSCPVCRGAAAQAQAADSAATAANVIAPPAQPLTVGQGVSPLPVSAAISQAPVTFMALPIPLTAALESPAVFPDGSDTDGRGVVEATGQASGEAPRPATVPPLAPFLDTGAPAEARWELPPAARSPGGGGAAVLEDLPAAFAADAPADGAALGPAFAAASLAVPLVGYPADREEEGADRRGARRYLASRLARLQCREGPAGPDLAVSHLDISETGARLVLSAGLATGREVEVELTAPGLAEPLTRLARVVWSAPTAGGSWGVGL
jgi:hypothetical protein